MWVCICAIESAVWKGQLERKWSSEQKSHSTIKDSPGLTPDFSMELYVKLLSPPLLPHTHTHTCRWMDRERWRAKVEAVWLILSSSVRKDWKRWVRAIESFWWGGLRLTDMHTNRYFLTGCQTDSSPYKPNFISQFLAPILNTLTRIDALTQTNI